MTNTPIEEQLGFDISQALTGIQSIDEALGQVVTNFQIGLASALETLTSAGQDIPPLAETLDVAGLGPAVDQALADATSTPLPIEADTAGLVSDVDTALADAGSTPIDVSVDGDTAPLTEAIDSATSVAPVIDVSADTSDATAAIDALNVTPVTVDVDADTSQAQDSLDALGVSATSAAGTGGSGLAGLSGAVLGIEAATGAATGEVHGLTSVIGGLSTGLGEAVAGGAAFTAFIGETVKLAADAQAQQSRFNEVFGQSAKIVDDIDVGGLVISLEELGKQSGTTAADLQASASRIGLLGNAAGAAKSDVAGIASDLLGLAGAISVANPRLGDTATVADTVSRALSTGRTRSLIPYGISLSAVAIQNEALNETQKTSVDQLTGYDKLVAGLTLALRQQGDTLGGTFKTGAQNAQVQLRALKVQLEETLVAIGKPLLEPVVASLESILPVAQDVGRVLGAVAQIVLPFVTALGPALSLVNPPLQLLAAGLGLIADAAGLIPQPVLVTAEALILAATAAGILSTAITALGLGAGIGAAGLVGLGAAGEALGAAFSVALGPIGLVVAGIGIIATVLGVFDTGAKEAKLDTAGLGSALFGTAESADQLATALKGTNDNLAQYLATQLKTGDDAKVNAEAISKLHLSYADLATAVSGTDKAFFAFTDGIRAHADAVGLDSGATDKFVHALFVQRDTLQSVAAAQLDQLLATHQITQAQFDQARSQNGINDALAGSAESVGDNVAALRDATRAAQENERATIAQGLSTGQLKQAFLDLRPAIAGGVTTTEDAQQVADRLGISLDDAKAAVDSLSTAMDAFVSTGLGALPSAGAAIDDFASGIASAQSALDAALKPDDSGTDPLAGVTKAQDAANQAIADNAEQTSRTVQAAKDQVAAAQADLIAAQKQGGDGQAAAIASAQRQVQSANDRLTKAIASAGQSNADAVKSGDRKVSDARQQAADSQNADAVKAKEAQDAYLRAIDPQRVIDAEFKNAFTIGAFQANLTKLLKAGRDNAVAALIAEGPEKGGQLANALVNDDTKAKAFDDGIAVANKVTSGYGNFLEEHKAELSGRLITLADGTVVDATDSFSGAGATLGGALGDHATLSAEERFHPNFSHRVEVAVQAAAVALTNDPTISQAAGEKGLLAVAAFETTFGPVTATQAVEIALAAAGTAIHDNTTVTTEAETKGTATRDAYLKGLSAAVSETGARLPLAVIPPTPAPAKVAAPKADIDGAKTVGEQEGQAAQDGLTSKFKPAEAVTAALAQVPPAIVSGMQPAIQAATTAGEDVTAFFAGHLHFGGEVTANMGSIPSRIDRASGTNNLVAAAAGFALGAAYGEGFAGGIGGAITEAANAAAQLAEAADRAARRKLGIASPSKAGMDLGRQYVAGIAQGLSELSPVEQATAALTLALIPDLRPVLKQTPSLAPGIVAASPTAARLAGASISADAPASSTPVTQRIESTITLNKTDPDPKHFADELAWSLQGF